MLRPLLCSRGTIRLVWLIANRKQCIFPSETDVSEQNREQTDRDESDGRFPAAPVVSYQMLALAAFVMAIPAAIPLIVIIEPAAVPFIPAVDSDDSGTYLFLIGLSAVMLIANWMIVFVVWRWLNRYAADSDGEE